MKNKIFFTIIFCLVLNINSFAQSQLSISNKYGVKFLSFEYQPRVHFIGLSLPLISGSAVSEEFTGLDFGLFLSGCSRFKYYPNAHLNKFSIRVNKFRGVAISGAITSSKYFNGLSINIGLTSIDYFTGFSFGGLSVINEINGVSINWLGAISKKAYGFSYGSIISGGVDFKGVSMSLIISGAKHFTGFSIGTVNIIDEELVGVQIGIVNYSKNLHGIQIGLLNIAENALIPYTLGINVNF